jgi:type I restriction enzyme S subunit
VTTTLAGVSSHWRIERLANVFQTQLGKMLSEKARTGRNSKPYLRNANVQWRRADLSDVFVMDFTDAEQHKFSLKAGDLLMCEGGEIGRTCLWREELPECYFQKAIHRLRPRSSDVFPEFYLYWMEWAFRYANIYGVTGTQTTIAHLPQEKLEELRIPVPNVSEQRAIAHVLTTVQQAKETRQRELALERERKAALMEYLFTFGIAEEKRAVEERTHGRSPSDWDVRLLDDCAFIQTGVAKGRKFNGAEVTTVPYLRVANVQNGYLDLSEIKEITIRKSELARYQLAEGDVVLTEGGDFDKLGRGFVWDGQVAPCVHQNHIFAVRPNRNMLEPDFLAYLVQSPYGRSYFLSVAHKTTNLACINKTKLGRFPVLVPTPDEQRRITSVLKACDTKISAQEREVARLQELFDALLQELLSGKRSVIPLISEDTQA